MKFIASKEALGDLRERLEYYRYIFEVLGPVTNQALEMLDKIEKTKGPIKAEKLKAKVAQSIRSFEWDCDGFFSDSYEEELKETVRLMKEAFGQKDKEWFENIPDFAPPVD